MTVGLRGWTVVAAIVVLLGVLASVLARSAQDRSPVAIAGEMRSELGEIRGSLDACLTVQDRLESDFDRLTDRTREVRSELDRLEGLDPRGVPAEHYELYLDLVDEYNESIPRWEERAESLRDQFARCRALVELHNERADSLRSFLVDEGLLERGWMD